MSRARGKDEVDLDQFLDDYAAVQRGELMEAFRELHESVAETVDAMAEGEGALAEIEEAIRRVEKVEHALMEARAIEHLRSALDAETL